MKKVPKNPEKTALTIAHRARNIGGAASLRESHRSVLNIQSKDTDRIQTPYGSVCQFSQLSS